jgi:NADH:ubiquinone oxidoreductase subunit 5 (subunit L)/multisubunit Na+/H+ antiporter MnhA subunit
MAVFTVEIPVMQNRLANALCFLALLGVLEHVTFFVLNMLLFMELIQMNPKMYLLIYGTTAFGVTIIWYFVHNYFVGRFKPNEHGTEATRTSSAELSRVSSLISTVLTTLVLILCLGMVFLMKLPEPIEPGDMHVVQNGMDTKSAIYTLWLSLLCCITVVAGYVIQNCVYVFDLYNRRFKFPLKANQA